MAAVLRALHPRHLRRQHGLILEEIQMPPRAPARVMPLRGRSADRTGEGTGMLQINPQPLSGLLQLRLLYRPRRVNIQGLLEAGLQGERTRGHGLYSEAGSAIFPASARSRGPHTRPAAGLPESR